MLDLRGFGGRNTNKLWSGIHINVFIFLYFDFGWTPPNIQQKLETVRLWYHIINSPDYRLPKRIFALDTTQWKKGLRLMFTGTKLIDVFDTNNTQGLSFTHIFDRIKNYLMSMCREKMCKSVEKMSRLANSKDFDSVLQIEEKMYVNSCKNRNNRSIMAKFRSSSFSKLEIEKGRIRNIEKSLRICKRCDSSSIDDEIHMLLYCSKFSQEREQLVSKVCM